MTKMRNNCRICKGRIITILDFKKVALSGNFLSKNQLNKEKKYSLKTGVCNKCKHLQIQNIIDPKKLFNHYDWETGISKSNLSLISDLLYELKKNYKLNKSSKILEIASNDSTLLYKFKKEVHCSVLGIDPAKNLSIISKKKNIDTVVDFFSHRMSVKLKKKYNKFDFCIARNVVAHTPNPNDIFKGLENILDKRGIFIIEVPHLENIYKDNQYDNIFHEHIGFHSVKSIIDLCNLNNLKLIDVRKIDSQGGSIRCFITKKNNSIKIKRNVKSYLDREKKIKIFNLKSWFKFAKRVNKHKKDLFDYLNMLNIRHKKISGYGASGKGQSLMQVCNIGKFLENIYDKSKIKDGKYTPGTHIKIIDPKELHSKNDDYLLLLSWNLKNEIAKQEKKFLKGGGKLIIPFPKPHIFKY